MNESKKRYWQSPKVVTLTKSNADENILTVCKGEGSVGESTSINWCNFPGCGTGCFIIERS